MAGYKEYPAIAKKAKKKNEQKSTGEMKRGFVMKAIMVEATRHEDRHQQFIFTLA
jgi:hypothetical protein